MQLDATRKTLLHRMWDIKQQKLAAFYQSKGKKFHNMYSKIRNITASARDACLARYYKTCKINYIKALNKWSGVEIKKPHAVF